MGRIGLCRALAGVAGVAFLLAGGPASAELPAAKRINATLVSPSAASAFYTGSPTRTTGPGAFTATPPEIKALARSLGGERFSAGQITADQLAQNVYDYVRNNIETEFRFGMAKGARGALIDGSGTPFDAAELMVKLIRQGGGSASYQVGTVTLTAQEFGLWSGFIKNLNPASQTFDVDAQAACQFLADGGIPATVNGASACLGLSGNLTTVTLAHIWVISNGKIYDPSFKHHKFKASIDLPAAMQCGTASTPTCGAAISNNSTGVMTGASKTTNPNGVVDISNPNGSAVSTQMSTFAKNLQHAIEASNPWGQLDDIIGGKEVDTSYTPAGATGLPYATSTPASTWGAAIAGDIPDVYRTTLRVQYNGIDKRFFSDEISTQRLRVFSDFVPGSLTSITSDLYVEDTLVQSTPSANYLNLPQPVGNNPNGHPQPVGSGMVTLSIDHPYLSQSGAYGDETVSSPGIEPYLIIESWGASSPARATLAADLQASDPRPFRNPTAINNYVCTQESGAWCDADGQPAEAATYFAQRSAADAIVGSTLQSAISTHHIVGLVSSASWATAVPATGSYTIDARSMVSVDSAQSNSSDVVAAFETATIAQSMIEGSVGQQTQDTASPSSAISNFTAVSSIKYVPNSQITTVFGSVIADPNNARGPMYQAAVAQGLDLITGGLDFISTGTGRADLLYGPFQVDYVMNGQFKGAGVPLAPDPAGAVQKTIKASDTGVRKKSAASISLATGGLTLAAPADLTTGAGDFPLSLSFQRTYQSDGGSYEDVSRIAWGANWTMRGPDQDATAYLGGGWTHNWDIFARINSDGLRGLGRSSALDASAAIASLVTLQDLLRSATFEKRTASVYVANWMAGQLINNSVTISRLPSQEVFSLLPDGRFNPPLGSSAKLSQTGSNSPITSQIVTPGWPGYWLSNNFAGVSFTYSGPGGDTIQFTNAQTTLVCVGALSGGTYTATGVNAGQRVFLPTSWTFSPGPSLTFSRANFVEVSGIGAPCQLSSDYTTTTRSYLTGVSSSLGRSLTFATTPINATPDGSVAGYTKNVGPGLRITRVTDETGRHADFAVSGCASMSPPTYVSAPLGQYSNTNTYPLTYAFACSTFTATATDSGITKYTYGPGADSPDPSWTTKPSYRLRRWYTPANPATPLEVFAYDDQYRVATATDILTHQTKYYPGGFADEAYKPGQTVDALGNVSQTTFDQWNSQVRSVDPLGRTVTTLYDSAHRPILKTNPEGDSVATVYDLRSNPLKVIRHAKPTAPAPDIITSMTYSEAGLVCVSLATCNKPTSSTDALGYDAGGNSVSGHVTNYSWDANGNLTQILKPAPDATGVRPQIDLTYDTANPWLLLTKTEKIDSGRSVTTSYSYDSANKYVLSTATVDTGGLALRTCFKFDAIGNLVSTSDPRATTCP